MNRMKAVTLAMIGAKGFHNLERSGIKNAATRGIAINKGRKIIRTPCGRGQIGVKKGKNG